MRRLFFIFICSGVLISCSTRHQYTKNEEGWSPNDQAPVFTPSPGPAVGVSAGSSGRPVIVNTPPPMGR